MIHINWLRLLKALSLCFIILCVVINLQGCSIKALENVNDSLTCHIYKVIYGIEDDCVGE